MTDVFNVIFILLVVIIKFYMLELNRQELWKDLLLNLVTNQVLCKNTYFLVYNMITKKMYQRISMIQDKMEKLQNIMPQDLGVSPLISMDLAFRRETMPAPRPKLKYPFIPYYRTIECITSIRNTESMICKLEYVYRLFTSIMTTELQEFWQGDRYFKRDKLFIDADSLKGLVIYSLVKSRCAKLLIDVICVEEFTPESIKFTNRAYYMTVLHSAFEFLEELTDDRLSELQDIINERISLEQTGTEEESKEVEPDDHEEPKLPYLQSEVFNNHKNFSQLLVNDYFPVNQRKISKLDSFIYHEDDDLMSNHFNQNPTKSF